MLLAKQPKQGRLSMSSVLEPKRPWSRPQSNHIKPFLDACSFAVCPKMVMCTARSEMILHFFNFSNASPIYARLACPAYGETPQQLWNAMRLMNSWWLYNAATLPRFRRHWSSPHLPQIQPRHRPVLGGHHDLSPRRLHTSYTQQGWRGAAQRGRYAVATSYAGDVPRHGRLQPLWRNHTSATARGGCGWDRSHRLKAWNLRPLSCGYWRWGWWGGRNCKGLRVSNFNMSAVMDCFCDWQTGSRLTQSWSKAGSKRVPSWFKTASKPVKTWFTQFTLTSLSFPSAQLLKPSTPKIDLVIPHFAPAAALVAFFAISRVAAWILSCLKAGHSP